MAAPLVRADVPLLVVILAAGDVAPRTVEAVDAARRRTDRVVLARPAGAPAPTRRFQGDLVDCAEVAALAAVHGETTGGATVVIESGAHGIGNRWLTDLAGALRASPGGAPAPAAAVPTTNGAPWPNCPPDLPDHRANRTVWRDFTRSLAGRPTELVDDVERLGSPAVALSPEGASAWAAAAPDGTLATATAVARTVARAGRRVARATGQYVHDERTVVLVSACLIMKDEAENLARCLPGLAAVADEVVIYDTGSTDGSIELARSMGAVVVPGHWEQDFAKARNAARLACRGTWLFHIDADEEIADPLAARDIRAVLERDIAVDLLAVPLFNMAGTELAPVRNPTPHYVPRILHRARCHWTGALHEHPMPRQGRGEPRTVRSELLSLLHYGYLDEVVARRSKGARNAEIAANRLDEVTEAGRTHFDRARTLVMNGRNDESLAEYALAAETAANPIHRRCALEHGALVLLNLGRPDEAEWWIARREAIAGEGAGVGRWLRARQAIAQGRYDDAIAALDGITDYTDNFSTNGPDTIHMMRAEALLGLERYDDAGDELVATLALAPAHDQAWLRVLHWAHVWPSVVERAARTVPGEQLKLMAGKLLSVPSGPAGLLAEALWKAHPNAPALLALGIELGPRLEIEQATRWSERLRAVDLAAHCPLRAIALDVANDPMRRLQAAYAAAERFGDAELAGMVEQLSVLFPA